ncbi:MAG TPA: glyoxalase [Nocardia sp.]|uniref:glyoxalase n=1 Tax=Nocardia TaxID=1817 RepID=UPI0024570611|nr:MULTISPECIES: glyoxalase [Nocardia]HLS75902.1 glyoxalase [Nocardia sp.]
MNITADQTTVDHIVLEVEDPAAAQRFLDAAFGLGDRVRVRAGDAPTSGFRGFVLSLVVPQPSDVDSYVDTAVAAGATVVKPGKKNLWGYGAVVQAPDGTLWKIATQKKKDSGPTTRAVEDFVVLLGVDKVKATKQCYAERGLTVTKSYGSRYVEFAPGASAVTLGLYGRRMAAKDAGVAPEGAGSHRLVLAGSVGSFTDPDGFVWEDVRG